MLKEQLVALNKFNEKYDVLFYEITNEDEATDLYLDIRTLYSIGKVDENDFITICEILGR